MSSDASVTFAWGDGEHRFRLPLGQLRELQDKTGTGPQALLNRMLDGSWRVDDLRETLRLGLIGGGMPPIDALVLVKRYVEDRPLVESLSPAKAILLAALVGVKDDPVGGKAETEETNPTMGGSASPSSTHQEPPSGGHPDRSTS